MILRLVREQLRTQWRYTAWSAGLLAFALALATYAMVTGATAIAFQVEHESLMQKEYGAQFTSIIGSAPIPEDVGLVNPLPFDEIQAMVARASEETSVEAVVTGFGRVEGAASYDWLSIAAVTPAPASYGLFATGEAPRHGEIAINTVTAQELGVGIGDTITVDAADTRGPKRSMTFIISGTIKAGNVAPYWAGDQSLAYVPWSDAREVALGLPSYRTTDAATGDVTTVVWTIVTWDGDSGTLAPYAERTDLTPYSADTGLGATLSSTDAAGYWAIGFAGLTVVGMLVAAFGMGRAQAEARTKWAATTRVLGATRGTVAAASIIETSVVSLAGIAAGIVAGIAGVAIIIGILRATHPEALLPSAPSVPALVILAGVGIGLAIAAVAAAVPAFWASRVAPVSALKPVTPVGEAQVSRNVGPWWIPGLFAGSVLAWGVLFWFYERGARSDSDPITVVLWIAFVFLAVSGVALVIEGSRVLVRRLGVLLSRARRPWLIAAGDGLSAHRRIYTFASIATFTLAAAATWTATSNAAHAFDPYPLGPERGEPPLPQFETWWNDQLTWEGLVGAVAWIAAIITFVAVVVTLSARATFAGDAATRAALGLSANGERLATAARQWIVMGAASIVGALLGWVAQLVTSLVAALLSPNLLAYSWHWNLTVASWGLAAAGVVIAVALAVTLAGSLAVGLLAKPRTPVAALRRAAG